MQQLLITAADSSDLKMMVAAASAGLYLLTGRSFVSPLSVNSSCSFLGPLSVDRSGSSYFRYQSICNSRSLFKFYLITAAATASSAPICCHQLQLVQVSIL
jgi:hypothetical protein